MRASVVIACLLASVIIASTARPIDPSDSGLSFMNFCHGVECPPFKLLNVTSKYQLRLYEGAKFVSTTIEGSNFEVGMTKGLVKLFRYIRGNNVDNAKISMTAPVITLVKPSADFKSAEKNYTTAFYLPQQFSGDAPAPKDEAVNIVDAEVAVYVKVFGGFGTGSSVLKQAQSLRQDLIQDGIEITDGAFAYAAYDGPQKLIHRHNEVWMIAADSDILVVTDILVSSAVKAVAQWFHN